MPVKKHHNNCKSDTLFENILLHYDWQIATTESDFFYSKCIENRLATGLRQGLQGGLQRSPRPLAGFKGPLRGRKGKSGKG